MSLSSLSSAENNILEQGPQPPAYPDPYAYYGAHAQWPEGVAPYHDPYSQYPPHMYDPNVQYDDPYAQGWVQDEYGNFKPVQKVDSVPDVGPLIK